MATDIAKHLIRAGRTYVNDFQTELMEDHHEAMQVRNLEDAIKSLTEVAEALKEVINKIVERLLQNDPSVPDYNARKRLVKSISALSATVSKCVVSEASECAQKGYDVDGLDALKAAYSQLDRSVTALKKTCPEPNKDMLDRTAENIVRGEVKPVKEILHGDDRTRQSTRQVG